MWNFPNVCRFSRYLNLLLISILILLWLEYIFCITFNSFKCEAYSLECGTILVSVPCPLRSRAFFCVRQSAFPASWPRWRCSQSLYPSDFLLVSSLWDLKMYLSLTLFLVSPPAAAAYDLFLHVPGDLWLCAEYCLWRIIWRNDWGLRCYLPLEGIVLLVFTSSGHMVVLVV